jgi:uncharacterized repeat protein (TIGR01451 family)
MAIVMRMRLVGRLVFLCMVVAVGLLACMGIFSGSVALALPGGGTPAPSWKTTVVAFPTVQQPGIGRKGRYYVVVENVGAKASEGEVTVKDVLPAGLTAIAARNEPEESGCSQTTGGEVVCSLSEAVVPSGFMVITVEYEVTGPVSGSLRDVAGVEGGGAVRVSGEASTRVGLTESETAPAGVKDFRFEATGPAGEPFVQAGGHPYFVTTTLLLNDILDNDVETNEVFKPVEPVKDVVFYLPLGFLGDPLVADQCPASLVELSGQIGCPQSSRVGTILPMVLDVVFAHSSDPTHVRGVYSVVPEKGYAAEFVFAFDNVTFFLYGSVVRHDGAYMLRVADPGLPGAASFVGSIATFYGDIEEHYLDSSEQEVPYDRGAFLTLPSDCVGAASREAGVEVSTWKPSEAPVSETTQAFSTLEGCDLLQFGSTLTSGPEVRDAGSTTEADEPSGYKLGVEVPQAPNTGTGLGTPPFESVSMAFPAGTSLSPGAASGLTACTATGPHGIDFPNGQGTAGAPGTETGEGEVDGEDGLSRPAQGHCPGSSQIGTVRASSPLLSEELSGHLYLAEPECGNAAHSNPCTPEDAANGSLYRLYLELEAPNRGVIIKLPGKALVNPSTGQITSVFEDTPQFPVSDLTIETTGGPRAGLANPQTCGTATTTGVIKPWSGGPASEPVGSFQVNEGCGVQGFAPVFTAGSVSTQAGEHSPFTLTLKREDREQDIGSVSTTLPQGLLADVASVAQCPEPQASVGGCPESSRVGGTTVGIGAGSEPYYQTGQVYFTGPYAGAPFGLSVVVPAVAGPFNLGNVIVRVALHIDPNTAQVTATSGPLPQIIDGVPLRIRTINVTLDNPAFTFNPTNCSQLSITGTVYSTQGATVGVSSPFQAAGCKNLPFKPSLSASTTGKTSKASGASLTVKVGSGSGQANIAKVRLTFPKQLPARLTTLQKACTEGQFNTNPAGCPSASVIGTANAHTPVLAHALTGPIYLVSHGGAAFPDAVIILQGEGVLLYLDGNTNIKKGITTSTFNSVPDAPISSFEAVLPEGSHSAFATDIPTKAKGNLCGMSLTLPATITGQNGAVHTQTTKIGVSGCPKAKKKKKKSKQKAKGRSHGKQGKGKGKKR